MKAILAGLAGATLGFAAGVAAGGAWAGYLSRRLAAAEAAAVEAMGRVGAGCEPIWMAAWPEGGCAARLTWPPVACDVRTAVYRHPDLARVLERVRAGGPRLGLAIFEERGARERPVPLSWSPEVPR